MHSFLLLVLQVKFQLASNRKGTASHHLCTCSHSSLLRSLVPTPPQGENSLLHSMASSVSFLHPAAVSRTRDCQETLGPGCYAPLPGTPGEQVECEETNMIPGCWVRGRKLTWLCQGLAIERKGLVQGGYLGRTEGFVSPMVPYPCIFHWSAITPALRH